MPASRSQIALDADALEEAVRASRLSVVLFDVEGGRIIAVSEPAERRLGLTGVDFESFDLVESASDPDGVRELLTWIRRGTATEWTWRSRLHSPDGAIYYADAVIRAIPGTPSHPRRCLAFYPSPPTPGSRDEPVVETFGDLTVGSVGADGRIECVRSVAPGLGFAPRRLSSDAPPIEVHGDDTIRIEKAARQILEDDMRVSTIARVREASGPWCAVRITLEQAVDMERSPDGTRQRPKVSDPQVAQERVVELERSLRQIAREVESAGFGSGAALPDVSSVPGLEDLSARQWDVVTRLLRGERVPTIAREMFLSQSTVRNYLWKTYRKFGVRSQAELLEKLHAATQPS